MTWEEEMDLKDHIVRIEERQIAMRREGRMSGVRDKNGREWVN